MWKILLGVGLAVVLAIWLLPLGEQEPLRFLGSYAIPTGEWAYDSVPVGEISGLAYDPVLNVYYGICDDRGDVGPAGRLYILDIPLDSSGIHNVTVYDMTLLDSDPDIGGVQTYARKAIDAEDIVFTPSRTFFVASERDLEDQPWIREFTETGLLLREISLPEKFMPAEGVGVRENLSFEAMTLTPDGKTLYVTNEQALKQDGPISTVDHGTTVRIIQYSLKLMTSTVTAEYAYVTEPIFAAPTDGDYADNGVPAMLYVKHVLPAYDLLTVERAYSSGVGNDIKIFGVSLEGAENVKDMEALPFPFNGNAVKKELLVRISAIAELSDIPIQPDNIEAIALGPKLPNGHHTLLLASDNNFNDSQRNLFLVFEIVP